MLMTKNSASKCSSSQGCHTATGTHIPHGITQCCLPPGRADIPALTPAEAGTRLSDPGGMQGWVDLVLRCCTSVVQNHRQVGRSSPALVAVEEQRPRCTDQRLLGHLPLHRERQGSATGSRITESISCPCLLDLSPAPYDTVDHDILINLLSSWFGIYGSVLSLFQSYLSSRYDTIRYEMLF